MQDVPCGLHEHKRRAQHIVHNLRLRLRLGAATICMPYAYGLW
jgi:hypothetical protein